ncbi:MAG: SIMPL domain-containing protein [Roseiflexaceae bacterium]|nr:SIMPL domain-containing protein [Roseiflexaceae bacterium]
MNRRIWTAAGLLAIAAMIVTLVGLATRPAYAQQTPSTTGRYVTVVGHAEVQARPDTAIIQIGVDTEAKTAKEALDQNSKQSTAVQKKLTDLGIDAKDIQTSGFSIYPTYATDGRQLTGYRVSNAVTIKIRSLDKAGALLDQVVQAGANSISGISFTIDNPRTLQDQAREQAMRDAKARADLLAKAGGASVGDVLIITENVGSAVPLPMSAVRTSGAQDSVNVPVQPGEQTIAIDVQVTYALK